MEAVLQSRPIFSDSDRDLRISAPTPTPRRLQPGKVYPTLQCLQILAFPFDCIRMRVTAVQHSLPGVQMAFSAGRVLMMVSLDVVDTKAFEFHLQNNHDGIRVEYC